MSTDVLSLKQVMLQDTEREKPKFAPNDEYSFPGAFTIYLPHDCHIDSYPKRIRLDREVPSIFVEYLFVPEVLRHSGIATRLLGSLVAHAKSNGILLIESWNISEDATKAEAAVVGEDNLHYYDFEHSQRELPMSLEQACDSIGLSRGRWHEYQRLHPDRDVPFDIGLCVIANLSNVDTASLELPVIS